jgi:hypothetical protein
MVRSISFRRALLILRLRCWSRVRVLCRYCVRFYAVDCSAHEMAQLEAVEPSTIVDLANALRYEVGATAAQPRLHVLCLGQAAAAEATPEPIRRRIMGTGWTCFCDWDTDTVVTSFGFPASIWRQVVHELTHLRRHIRAPEGVYEWLQEVSGMSSDELEESFHQYCAGRADP